MMGAVSAGGAVSVGGDILEYLIAQPEVWNSFGQFIISMIVLTMSSVAPTAPAPPASSGGGGSDPEFDGRSQHNDKWHHDSLIKLGKEIKKLLGSGADVQYNRALGDSTKSIYANIRPDLQFTWRGQRWFVELQSQKQRMQVLQKKVGIYGSLDFSYVTRVINLRHHAQGGTYDIMQDPLVIQLLQNMP